MHVSEVDEGEAKCTTSNSKSFAYIVYGTNRYAVYSINIYIQYIICEILYGYVYIYSHI